MAILCSKLANLANNLVYLVQLFAALVLTPHKGALFQESDVQFRQHPPHLLQVARMVAV